MSERTRRRFPLVVLAACLLHVALVLLARPGFTSSDDEVYARLAHDLATGQYELALEHRANRFGIIAPTALLYAVAGVGPWTTVLWSLTWSLLGIVLVGLVARRAAGDAAGSVAALLFAVATSVVNVSTFLLPDGPVGVQMAAAAACMWVARDATGRRAAAWGAAAAAFVAAGVLTKLTVLWIAPWFGVLFVADVARRRNGAAWGAFAVVGALTAVAFFGAYGVAAGDPFYRVRAVDTAHNETHWAYDDADAGTILARLTYAPALMLARTLPELTLLIAIAAAATAAVRDDTVRRHVRLWVLYAAVVIGAYWVGTTSATRIAPLPLLPRMLLPATAPLAVVAGCALARGGAPRGRVAVTALLLLAAGAVDALDGRLLVAATYAFGATAAGLALAGSGRLRAVGVAGVLALPLAMCGYSIAREGVGESRALRVERRLVERLAEKVGPDAIVLTDRRSERTFAFHRGYRDAPPEVRVWDGLERLPDGPAPLFAYRYDYRVRWRGGRAAAPDWLEAVVRESETVWESPQARLVRIER